MQSGGPGVLWAGFGPSGRGQLLGSVPSPLEGLVGLGSGPCLGLVEGRTRRSWGEVGFLAWKEGP